MTTGDLDSVNAFRPFDFSGLDILLYGDKNPFLIEYLSQVSKSFSFVEANDALSFQKAISVDAIVFFNRAPSSILLAQLREEGVLIQVCENAVSLNAFQGKPTDIHERIGESLCQLDLPQTSSLTTQKHLEKNFADLGFSVVDKFYLFPNLKTPATVLSENFVDDYNELASDLASAKAFVSDEPYFRFFPETLALRNIANAGLLKEMSSAFLWIGSKGPSRTRLQLTKTLSQGELAWHFSNRRKIPLKTFFKRNADGLLQVHKAPLLTANHSDYLFRGETLQVEWSPIPSAPIVEGRKLSALWADFLYSGRNQNAYRLLKEFISWSFERWKIEGDSQSLQGKSLDALLINASETKSDFTEFAVPRDFALFDLEWKLKTPVSKSWFIFRNVFCLRFDFELLKATTSYCSLKELYETLCQDLLVPSQFEKVIALEAEFQALVTETATKEFYHDVISHQSLMRFKEGYFPRNAKAEVAQRNQEVQLRLQKQELEAILDRKIYRFAAQVEAFLKNKTSLKKFLKLFLIAPKVVKKIRSLKKSAPSPVILSPLEKDGNGLRMRFASKNGVLPTRGWVQIQFKLNQPLKDATARLQITTRGIPFYTSLDSDDSVRYETLLKLSDEMEDLFLEIVGNPEQNSTLTVKKATLRQISKFEAAFRLIPPQLPTLLKNPELLKDFLSRGRILWRDGKIRGLIAWFHQQALMGKVSIIDYYSSWISLYDTLTEDDRIAIRKRVQEMKYQPLISIVMPVYNTDEQWLVPAIESILNQLYPHWELCIADDASTLPSVRKTLERYSKLDSRIKVVFREKNGHISASSNSALEICTGEFVALFDHDDEMTEHALFYVADALNRNSSLDLIYSDEDKIDLRDRRYQPHFKPDWNEELFYSYNLVTHLAVFRHALVKEVGGFRLGYEGSQDYDLVLRVTEKTHRDRIYHIPHVLYHWRAIPGSTAGGPGAKQYAYEAGRRAIRDHFKRMGIHAQVTEGISGSNRVQYDLPTPAPLVSCIICTRDRVELLKVIVDGLLHSTDYPAVEVIIINNQSVEKSTLEYFESLKTEPRVRVLPYDAPFNFAAMNNLGVRHAKGSLVAFINNDLKVIHSDWLTELVRFACQKNVGAVGAKLYYPDGSLQHGGIVLGIGQVEGYQHGIAGHSHKGFPKFAFGFIGRTIVNQCFSAVTGACIVTRKEIFNDVGGFDEKKFAVAFNDVDLCLRIRERGFRIVWTPYSELFHFESASRGSDQTPQNFARFQRECDSMMQRWSPILANDPAYNPNLTLEKEDFSLAFPPRVSYPWKTAPEPQKDITPLLSVPSGIEHPVTTETTI